MSYSDGKLKVRIDSKTEILVPKPEGRVTKKYINGFVERYKKAHSLFNKIKPVKNRSKTPRKPGTYNRYSEDQIKRVWELINEQKYELQEIGQMLNIPRSTVSLMKQGKKNRYKEMKKKYCKVDGL